MSFDSARDIAPLVFSDTYFEARKKFLAAAPASTAYPSSAKGPGEEALFTDAAYFGKPDAKNLLVLISATHGPEGYCGSAAQLLFLEAKLHENLPSSTAVLLIHALNCYGFAWDRRVTAEGCDLNRNFVDFSQPLPPNPGYQELAEHFVPLDISPEGVRRAEAQLEAYRALHGDLAFREARGSGQYTNQGGMFFGGTAPSEARETLERIAKDFDVQSRERVVIVDYHTGLGPYGYGELECEQVSGADGHERALKIFGPSATSPVDGSSASTALHGSLDEFWERSLGDRHTYVVLEFGTLATGADDSMRKDHWLLMYHPEEGDSELGREIRKATKDYFYPEKDDWKEMVAWRSHQVHRQAMEALARSN